MDKIIKQLKTKWQKQIKKTFSSRTGSAAIILSLVASGTVLSTIFHTQKTLTWFLSTQSENTEEWQLQLVAKYGLATGSYLIANNLILCKEDGWANSSLSKCQWNLFSEINFEKFGFEKLETITINNDEKVLRLTGAVTNEIPNLESKDYTISFNLVNWRDTSIRNLIGEIPDVLCRNTRDNTGGAFNIRTDLTCDSPDSPTKDSKNRCKNSAENPQDNTVCDYISNVDQDYYIVLMSVEQEGSPALHAGIRRPLSSVKVEVVTQARCSLACPSSITPQGHNECRGEFVPSTGNQTSTLEVKVTNNGPGTLYSLSLLRTDTPKNKDINVNNDLDDIITIHDAAPLPTTHKVTPEILSSNNREYLMPGEYMIFEDTVECRDSISYTVGRSGNINIHSEVFMTISYEQGSMKHPTGVCMNNEGEGIQIKEDDSSATSCPQNYQASGDSCGTTGQTGTCHYPRVEPRRLFTPFNAASMDLVGTNIDVPIPFDPPH